jgi:hypothetical protein
MGDGKRIRRGATRSARDSAAIDVRCGKTGDD